MRHSALLAISTVAALLGTATLTPAQNPFAEPSGPAAPAAQEAAAPANPFAAMPAEAAPAPQTAPVNPFDAAGAPAPPTESAAAPDNPFAAPAPEAAAQPETAPAQANPFAAAGAGAPEAEAAAPANPFAGPATGVSAPVSPFGAPGDVAETEEAGAVASVFDPTTYWYKLDIPAGGTAEMATGAIREEIPYSEYKRRYNERVQVIEQQYAQAGPQAFPGIDPNQWNPRAMAEWKVYYEQVEAWKRYVEDNVLGMPFGSALADVDFASLDQAGVDQAIETIVGDARLKADELTRQLQGQLVALVQRLDQRQDRRLRYEDWRMKEMEEPFLEFAERWIKQSEGVEINIDGNMYLISEKPIQNAPRNVLPVVTSNLTPYDIFNEDGTLKRPQ
ncbi:MAG: hypothetical protein Kow0059_22990 [Candidatus Sumerlaeia bacterium]